MDIQELLFLALLFIAVFVFIYLAIAYFAPNATKNRIAELSKGAQLSAENTLEYNSDSELVNTLVKVVDPISKLSSPDEEWNKSPLYVKFMNAGLRTPAAPTLFFGAKSILAILFALIGFFCLDKSVLADTPKAVFFLLIFALFGYYLPGIWLERKIKIRKREIFENLPDATDLLIICMEAGLSFDQALAKVASEVKIKSKILSQELELILIEVRSGFTRERALKNLALRVGVDEVDSLAMMINQSERFGTSVGDALRIHSDNARTIRKQKAEEAAAKISLKFMFPLIFCLLPALMMVMVGPSIIQLKDAIS